jgi:hypothetical protein
LLKLNQPLYAVLLNLKRYQVISRYLILLLSTVPRNFYQLEAVQQRGRQLQGVSSADEHDFGEIYRDGDVVVHKGIVLGRI